MNLHTKLKTKLNKWFSNTSTSQKQERSCSLKINIFSAKNGKGLEADQKILADALIELGCEVHYKNFRPTTKRAPHVDINIFFELLVPSCFSHASANWFIPNPELYIQDLALLDKIDLILCRTREVEKIFNALGNKTYFIGFTSLDCYDSTATKDYRSFFHLGGGSSLKGTRAILNTWLSHSELPSLIAIRHKHPLASQPNNLRWIPHRIETQTLRSLQNVCGVHLCPSETEGFGHYLMEAMSAGAVVVTTGAPPMNEFISDFLVPYERTARLRLGIKYYINEKALLETIQTIASMPTAELERIGAANRKLYLEKTQEFKTNLRELIHLSRNCC